MTDEQPRNVPRPRTEADLSKDYSRLLLQSVLDTVGEAIIAVDRQGTIVLTNQATADMWGYSIDSLEGMNLVELMPQKFRAGHLAGMNRYLNTGQARVLNKRIELEGLHADKRIFPLEILISENSLDGEKVFTAALRDITHRKQQDRLLLRAHRLEVVEQLSGGLAHDFNNLCSIIKGNLRFIADDLEEPGEEVSEALADAISATDDCSELTSRLLAFSQGDFLEPKVCSINRLLRDLTTFLAEKMGRSVSLVTEIASDDLFVELDSGQLENALVNLVLNAREAMPDGGDILVKAERYQRSDSKGMRFSGEDALTAGVGYVVISVTDSGEGIGESDLSRVFEPFFTTKDIGRGSGLGLSMVHGFTEQSKGHCFIRSEIGVGTTVSMYFPQSEADAG